MNHRVSGGFVCFPHGEHSKSLDVLGALLNFCVERA